jgi:sugar lactone lactonase YvrE
VLVTQNGGLDWDAIGIPNPDPGAPTTPGIQRIGPDGSVRLLTGDDGPFRAPNDLVAEPDGTVLFTDPPQFPAPPEPSGRVWRWRPGGRPEVIAAGFNYCNGIGVEHDGCIVIVEDRGLLRLGADGSERRWLIETLPHGGDGFAFDVEHNIYVCGGTAVTVVSPEGEVLDILESPDSATMMTNCCFGGDDLRTLYSTDGRSGRVLAFPGMPVAGRPLVPYDA